MSISRINFSIHSASGVLTLPSPIAHSHLHHRRKSQSAGLALASPSPRNVSTALIMISIGQSGGCCASTWVGVCMRYLVCGYRSCTFEPYATQGPDKREGRQAHATEDLVSGTHRLGSAHGVPIANKSDGSGWHHYQSQGHPSRVYCLEKEGSVRSGMEGAQWVGWQCSGRSIVQWPTSK